MSIFDSFEKKHDFLVCVDSDGCAMDTMNCKHFHCFGPCMVNQWELEQWRSDILDRWNQVNLFQMTRGINRFKGLSLALTEVNEKYTPIAGVEALNQWVATTKALSNDALKAYIATQPDGEGKACLEKALAWSKEAKANIALIPGELMHPFPGALECLRTMGEFADVVVVSGANRDTVLDEWKRHQLIQYADLVLTQENGTKTACIRRLMEMGYNKEQVLMVGDAPGDCDAAEENGVGFFPILVEHEQNSWEELRFVGLHMLKNGLLEEYLAEQKRAFLSNLGG
jgi:phosphoglycolate phosphatase-like HAD superfamily hydrolase